MRGAFGALAVVLVVFVSGCAGGADEIEATGGGLTPLEDGAQVSGNILNEEGLPVGGAVVALQPADGGEGFTSHSGQDGGFAFDGVPDGEYRLLVSTLGYKAVGRAVSVTGGASVPDIVVTLEAIPIPEAYHLIQQATMEITLGLAWQVGGGFNSGCIVPGATCQGIAYPAPNRQFPVEELEGSPLATLVLEETWEPNSAVCAKAISIDLYSPETESTGNPSFSNPHYWTNSPSEEWSTTSPVVMVIQRDDPADPNAIDHPDRIELNDGEAIDPAGDWTVRNFPPGEGLTNQAADINCFTEQRMDVYFTTFFLEPMPTGFSARPEA